MKKKNGEVFWNVSSHDDLDEVLETETENWNETFDLPLPVVELYLSIYPSSALAFGSTLQSQSVSISQPPCFVLFEIHAHSTYVAPGT